jgi:hypothetical protein
MSTGAAAAEAGAGRKPFRAACGLRARRYDDAERAVEDEARAGVGKRRR